MASIDVDVWSLGNPLLLKRFAVKSSISSFLFLFLSYLFPLSLFFSSLSPPPSLFCSFSLFLFLSPRCSLFLSLFVSFSLSYLAHVMSHPWKRSPPTYQLPL
ncbi:hypothetical protein CSUI_007119 [Cystoisospora suis]|uniref:Transmembrane protein n=1 Tax=Cystoisospora suis TaxID=483139 RepID=A0A2C6KRI3_9APIC|nr:hypothetical protein CSUI_007119 [Cystoisospora suis]